MPNSNTFTIKPIKALIERVLSSKVKPIVVDPFVRNSPFKSISISNDLDETIEANYNMDALDFLKSLKDQSVDILLYDPPYSVRQVSECYKKLGKTVNFETTQSTFWTYLKAEIARICKTDSIVVSCGWNSGGIGKTLGFNIEEILMVPHGGPHNDTIITVERKI